MSPSTKHVVDLFRVPRRAQIALTQAVETEEDFNQFRNFRDCSMPFGSVV
jgi:hypothetical protein